MSFRSRCIIDSVFAIEQSEGAGARVRRSIGGPRLKNLDPFLLLDEGYVAAPAGFPDHPHRGFETVSYILPSSEGGIDHEDFTGKKSTIRPGGVQWMSAGKGIVHSEVPSADGKICHGLQLWVNLPASEKMKEPTYQEYTPENLPYIEKDGVTARIIAGSALGVVSPTFTSNPTSYVHFIMESGKSVEHYIPKEHEGFIYILDGAVSIVDDIVHKAHNLLVLSSVKGEEGQTDGVKVSTVGDKCCSFVIITAKPLREPIVQYGPFVMNTKEDIIQTISDYQEGKNGFENAIGWSSELKNRVHN